MEKSMGVEPPTGLGAFLGGAEEGVWGYLSGKIFNLWSWVYIVMVYDLRLMFSHDIWKELVEKWKILILNLDNGVLW